MQTIKDVLIAEGFEEGLIDENISPESYQLYGIDSCESIYVSSFLS